MASPLDIENIRKQAAEQIKSDSNQILDVNLSSIQNATPNSLKPQGSAKLKSYDDFVKKYESYRAKCIPNEKGCNMPLNLKADSFNMSEIKHAPIIKPHHYEGFKKYAKIRGVKFDDNILKICDIADRFDKVWQMRDKKCKQIIRKMRIEGIPPVEKDGKFKNMPTIDELHLISLLSTNICCEELDIIIDNIKKTISQ